jgi:thiamine biosynthesis lipoprotein
MQLCAQAGGPPVPVSEDLFRVLDRAVELSRRSDGAFDVTVGPLVALWREARTTGRLPSQEQLDKAREAVGWQKIRLDRRRRTVQLLVPGMKLDLGGIAKGYAADSALATLRENGITRALIEAGGDIVVGDSPPDRDTWRIDLPPGDDPAQPRSLLLARGAVSTSGDTEQFVEIDGKRYSHIVDPRTGLGLTDRVSTTVLAPNGLTADSLATAACLLDARRAATLIRSYPGARLLLRVAQP